MFSLCLVDIWSQCQWICSTVQGGGDIEVSGSPTEKAILHWGNNVVLGCEHQWVFNTTIFNENGEEMPYNWSIRNQLWQDLHPVSDAQVICALRVGLGLLKIATQGSDLLANTTLRTCCDCNSFYPLRICISPLRHEKTFTRQHAFSCLFRNTNVLTIGLEIGCCLKGV